MEQPDPTFTRRKFTITESLDDVLQDMAAQHYQNNISLCIRAAIEDHRTTLRESGTEQFAVQQLSLQIEQLVDQQESIESRLTAIQEQLNSTTATAASSHPDTSAEMTEDMKLVSDQLEAAAHGQRLQDLNDQLEIPIDRLQTALHQLVDQAIVTVSDQQPPRFHLAGYQTIPQNGES